MTCDEALRLLEPLAAGAAPADCGASPEEAGAAEAHAAACDACRAARDDVAATAARLSRALLADRAAGAEADAALAAAVEARLPAGGVLRPSFPRLAVRAAVVLAAVGAGWAWTSRRGAPEVTRETYPLLPDTVADYGGPRFTEALSEGLRVDDHTGVADRKDWMVETVGHGAAAFDMDGDGDLDLFVPDGNRIEESQRVSGTWRLLRNDGEMRFEDVTAGSGLECDSWAGAAVAGDLDDDGLPDLYVPCFGRNHVFRNLGGGRFEDVTERSGAGGDESEWSTAAALGDLDGDGDLDLYVSNYAAMRSFIEEARSGRGCTWRSMQVACGPAPLVPQRDRLFLNRGDGTFEDATERGLPVLRRYAFQASILDLDGDGHLDVYVACDTQNNLVLRNDGTARFTEMGLVSGAGICGKGVERAGMGVATGDVDGDGRIDVFVTNFSHEPNTLFRNVGVPTLAYADATAAAGLEGPSQMTLGWGAAFADLDADGDLDLAYANGHLYPGVEKSVAETTYAQHLAVFENDGSGRFREVTASAGDVVRPRAHRGLVAADFDDDGATDLFVTVLNGRAVLFRNDARGHGRSVRFLLRRRGGRVEAAGATLEADVEGERGRTRIVRGLVAGSSFGSCEDPRVAVGLGASGRVTAVRVRFPGTKSAAPASPPAGETEFAGGAVYLIAEGETHARRVR